MRVVAVAALLALAGCARPLSTNEAAFATALYGPEIDVAAVRVVRGLGLAPPPASRIADRAPVDLPAEICARQEMPRAVRPPAGVAIGSFIFLAPSGYSPDTLPGYPDRLRVPHALLMAHELAHVWQWQNRRTSGYSPLRAAIENIVAPDPYFYDALDRPFLSFGYEQQAALIEDWLCYRIRRARPSPRGRAARDPGPGPAARRLSWGRAVTPPIPRAGTGASPDGASRAGGGAPEAPAHPPEAAGPQVPAPAPRPAPPTRRRSAESRARRRARPGR